MKQRMMNTRDTGMEKHDQSEMEVYHTHCDLSMEEREWIVSCLKPNIQIKHIN